MTMSDTKETLVARVQELEAEAVVNHENTQAIVEASEEAALASAQLDESQQEVIKILNDDINILSATDEVTDEEGNVIIAAQTGLATLRAEIEEARAEVEADKESSEIETYRANPMATFPEKIEHWLYTAHNVHYGVENILIQDISSDKIQYRVKDSKLIKSTQTMGIGLLNSELVEPPVHNHTFYQDKPGDAPVCRCGSFQLA